MTKGHAMNFRDRRLTCDECGQPFFFTVTEQRQLYESGQAEFDPDTGEIVALDTCPTCRMRDPETGRLMGRVKWFNLAKGYGFIVKPDADEIFFHRSQVVEGNVEAIDEGVAVSFDQIVTEKGPEAKEVKIESD
jgi:cold shock CspA family protein